MEWKSIQINKQNVKKDTGSAVLIAMPHNSIYDGFTFWHSSKLIRAGKHSYALSLGYTNDFVFKLKKVSPKTFKVLDEKEIGVQEFEEAFGIMNDNIVAPKKDTESYLIVKEPEKVDKNIEILEELKNDKQPTSGI